MKIDVSTQDGYDLACALRGPDIKSRDGTEERLSRLLKLHTAGRFRHLAGYAGHGVVTARPIDHLDRENLLKYGAEIGDRLADYSHYIRHAKAGARALGRLKPDCGTEMGKLSFLMQRFLNRIANL